MGKLPEETAMKLKITAGRKMESGQHVKTVVQSAPTRVWFCGGTIKGGGYWTDGECVSLPYRSSSDLVFDVARSRSRTRLESIARPMLFFRVQHC